MSAFVPLNWKEVALLVGELDAKLRDTYVDRVVVPVREHFPDGFLKNEWAIRLSRGCLLIGLRPRQPYFEFVPGKGPLASEQATQSVFGLALAKHLKGAKILSVTALPRERAIEVKFAGELSLLLILIPATPEAVLLAGADQVLARSRPLELSSFSRPDGKKAPEDMACRKLGLEEFGHQIEAHLKAEAFQLRKARAEKLIRESVKRHTDRIRQSETARDEAAQEADWRRLGELLKATLPHAPEIKNGVRAVQDYETGRTLEIPCDPKLDARAQVTKFFSLAKRKDKRASEAQARIATAKEALVQLNEASAQLAHLDQDWVTLARIEADLGLTAGPTASSPTSSSKDKQQAWPGRRFTSQDGWSIWVGRDKTENLELTFKCGRGNDVWMHVRGKPGAHLLIPVQPGKSVPLETLLDAAQLAIQYSGGENWGATEVDYTFKKFVKRIRDSSEASYTRNKTLIVRPDPKRLKRLMS